MSNSIAVRDPEHKPLSISPILEAIGPSLAEFNANAQFLLAQAQRAEVRDQGTLGRAGELARSARALAKEADDLRTKVVKPLNGLVKQVNELVKPITDTAAQAKSLIEGKQTAFIREEQKRAAAAAAAERKRIEDEALRLAESQAQLGDQAGADIIMESGAQAAESLKVERVKAIGDYGATVGSRRVVTGEVTAIRAFLKYIASDFENPSGILEFKQAALNELARLLDRSGETVPGFNVKIEEKANNR